MKFPLSIYIVAFFFFFSTNLNAQVNILLDKSTDLAASPGVVGSSSVGNSNSAAAAYNSYPVKVINEFKISSDILPVGKEKTTYKDLDKLAADPKSNYLHPNTNTLFPYNLGEFERKQIVSYPKEKGKIAAIYSSPKDKSSLVISLTPTWEANEGRLRNEYLKKIKELSKEEGKKHLPKPAPVKFKGRDYICNGVQGIYGDEKSYTQLTVYECGVWLLSIKLKAYNSDSVQFSRLNDNVTVYFNPSGLTALSPLNLKSNVTFEREALKDTVMTSALVSSAFKKMNWASENISEMERHSGFPDIYLAMHIASLREYIQIQGRKKNINKDPKASQYYEDVKAINNAGFLPEFIMEQYDNVMIVPYYVNLNFEAFNQWKQGREISVNLREKQYTITYRNLPY
ncbi:MAG: hypothetical protein ACYC2P_07170 [Paludibacteraceae bacterium]